MPFMKPPHYQGLYYNSRKIADGELVDVLDRDVEALAAAGWAYELAPPPPVLDVAPTAELDHDEEE